MFINTLTRIVLPKECGQMNPCESFHESEHILAVLLFSCNQGLVLL